MLKHQFSDFSYAVNTDSAKKGYKEILVCYIYNGVEVLRKVYVPEGPGISYIFEARKIIDKEIKDGTLSSYSYRFIRRNKKRKIKPRKIVKAVSEGKSIASVAGFTSFAYVTKPCRNLRKKFAEVSYNYNGEKVIRTYKIRGLDNDEIIAKAKAKIKEETESGFLEKYSEKYLKGKALLNSTPTRTPVVRSGITGATVGAITAAAVLAIAGAGTGMYFLGKSLIPQRNEFSVSLYSRECVLDGVDTVKRDELYKGSVEVKPEFVSNYRPDVEAIFMGHTQLDETQYVFNLKEHTLEINVPATDDIVIVAYGISLESIVGEISYGTRDDGSYKITGITAPEGFEKGDITEVIIPKEINNEAGVPIEVKEIVEGALAGCGNITDLTVPFIGRYKEAPTTLNDDEMKTSQMIGSIFGDKNYSGGVVTWQDYYINEDDVPHKMKKWVIPHDLSDVVVTGGSEIGLGAFSECTHINDIVFSGNSATKIEDEAFYNCKALETVTFVGISNVKEIGESAFANCGSLLDFDLSNIETVHKNAFNGCSGLQKVFIPNNVSTVESGAFASVGGLIMVQNIKKPDSGWADDWTDNTTAVVYGATPDMKELTDEDAGFHFILATEETEENELRKVAYVTEFIGDQKAKSVTIPNELVDDDTGASYPLRYLGSAVFYQYIYTEEITFECTQLLSIGNYCFAGCSALATISFSEPEYMNEATWSLERIGVGAFYNCKSLVIENNVTQDYAFNEGLFPSTLYSVGDNAFYNCESITKLALSNVTSVGASAFEGCSNLTYVKVHANASSFGRAAFLNCSKLSNVFIYYNVAEEEAYHDVTHKWYGEDFKEIPEQCFMNSSIGNEGAKISAFTLSIGASAFENCKITKVTFPEKISKTKLINIGSRAFYNCANLVELENLDQNNSLQEIGEAAFQNCSSLTEINLTGAELTAIPASMCEGCGALTKFCPSGSYYSVIPNTVTEIGERAFANCLNLGYTGDTALSADSNKALRIPNGAGNLTSIGKQVFEGWASEDINVLIAAGFSGGQRVYLDDSLISEDYSQQTTIHTNWGWELSHVAALIMLDYNMYKCATSISGSTTLIFNIMQ